MSGAEPASRVVVGVDGSGRSRRLDEIAAAARGPVVRLAGGVPAPDLAQRLGEPGEGSGEPPLVLVDDAHRLDEATAAVLIDAARRGVPLVLARRPSVQRPDLAALEDTVVRGGRVESLRPLEAEQVAGLVAEATGRPADQDTVGAVLAASAGMPAIAAALVRALPGAGRSGPGDAVPPDLAADLQRRLALLPAPASALARVLALRVDVPDDVLAAAAGIGAEDVAPACRALRDAGFLVPAAEVMIPAVARAILEDTPPAQQRAIQDRVARALLETGTDPVVAAEHLRAARARTPLAGQAFAAAGERLRWTDPAAALAWLDDAVDAGADPSGLAASRAEAAALLGVAADLDQPWDADPALSRRLALVAGAVAAHEGRSDRCAQALIGAGAVGRTLAVPALAATGRPAEARAANASASGPVAVVRMAEAALAATDPTAGPDAALPILIEAAEAVERTPPALVLPDTPHALGAVVAVAAGDAATAKHLLGAALAAGCGGPVATDRHRLLLAWVRLRVGDLEEAVAELRRLSGTRPAGRERVLRAAVTAGLARRRGDVAALRECWAEVEPVLARRSVDLFGAEIVEELAVAATRLRQAHRVIPLLDDLDAIVERLGRPPAWVAVTSWSRLQVAVAGEDAAAAAQAAQRLSALTGDVAGDVAGAEGVGGRRRWRAQAAAAAAWAASVEGSVQAEAVLAAADDLAGAGQLPWEASRLAGHAAIRAGDPRDTRRLLERARELSGGEIAGPAGATAATAPGPVGEARTAGLSEREVEVARLVLAGRTYREIGAQLYIAPKTVEHHVARIRTKLGARTRAEFVAALRGVLDDEP